MDIAITGAGGLIGSALARSLEADGHRAIAVTRTTDQRSDAIRWDPATGTIDANAFEGLDAVVHLAGEPIASAPWTAKQRTRIHDSRTQGTRLLASTLAGLDTAPSVLVSGSAIGYYGDRGDHVLTEGSAAGDDFLARVCRDWEAATGVAEAAGIRVVHARTGIVLDAKGGALGKQLPIFKLGLGGRAGNGQQWFSWISLADEVGALRHAIEEPQLRGAVNLTAPNAVTNAEFTEELGRALHRPTALRIPRLVERLPFGIGDLAGSLLFTSARVAPTGLLEAGYRFHHPDLPEALAAVLA
jgi:uncharacterized protein (TIGR01777 family)